MNDEESVEAGDKDRIKSAPEAGDERSARPGRRGQHHRATRRGVSEGEGALDQTRDDTDAGWGERPQDRTDRWWREQRPPHWG